MLEGIGDDLPEPAFYMVGNLKETYSKAKELAMQAAENWEYIYMFKLNF